MELTSSAMAQHLSERHWHDLQAGCCTLKTKSGDWAELAEAAVAANNEESLKQKSGEAVGGTELHALATASGIGLLESLQPSSQLRAQLQQVLEHHVPQSVRRNIRYVTTDDLNLEIFAHT